MVGVRAALVANAVVEDLKAVPDVVIHGIEIGETDRRIGQIGRDCGFNDPDNLKRLFRKRFGMSMRDYRNKNN